VANANPTANFTNTVNNLAASFTSTSTDTDGTIASYAWDFGDGGTSTAANPNHTYGSADTYSVTLTVTDNDGATDSETKDVTVTAPTQIAWDDFNRTVNNGFGTAELGGAWTTSGTTSNFAVSGGNATIRMATGSGPGVYLNSVSARDVELNSTVSYDKARTGGGAYTSFIVRRSGNTDYRAVVRTTATAVTVQIQRTVSGTATVLGSTVTLTGGALAANDTVNVKFQAVGNGTTTLRAKVWRSTDTEPTAWTVTTTDGTAALQNAGGVGLYSYLSGSATNGPIVARFASFEVKPA
jgi:PKD repeat protein